MNSAWLVWMTFWRKLHCVFSSNVLEHSKYMYVILKVLPYGSFLLQVNYPTAKIPRLRVAISWYKTPECRIVCTVNAILLRQGSKKAASFDFPVLIINESLTSYMKLRRIEQLCLEEKSQSSTSPTKNYMSTQLNHCRLVCGWFLGPREVSWTEH